ncbi:GntT/GntP/DsdX family permease [Pseudomonas sp. GM55]|jgi:GntP family gluconate:H+ symporter/D-serine transporter|uniref:GntT/GntP/DsdX family permease n=1 Tax=Pseudomonas sp. GM55 TaxID=1144333 RepID=UPI0002707807|nr:gluconate:H+ symporter [Pseudomonas sp. GM55]EJM66492.1 gluconate transporter [Pseudomonas sp. GM55]
MHSGPTLLLVLFSAIILIVFLIVKVRVHAFLALTAASFVVGIGSGMPLAQMASSYEKGVGGTLGFLATIIGLGGILGKMLEESGGAERIAQTLLSALGKERASWAMMLVGFIAGIPVFFEVGFVLLIPLIYVVAKETRINLLYLGVPLAVSLMAVHCMLPPHPAAMAITGLLGADVGKVIVYGLLIALPTAIIAGPLWIKLVCKSEAPDTQEAFLDEHCVDSATRDLPGLGLTLLTILLPLLLMVGKSFAAALPHDSGIFSIVSFLGTPLIALSIAVVFAYWALGLRRGLSMPDLLVHTQKSFPPLASILLIIGAGGAFNGILVDSGVGNALSGSLTQLNMNPIVLAWLVAGLMHFAVGSATVAMISAAGMVMPMLSAHPTVSKEIICIAIGAGAIGWTHVTDSAFWVVKEYLGVSLAEALKKFTSATVLASLIALGLTLLLSQFV